MNEMSLYRLWKMTTRWRWWFYLITTFAVACAASYPIVAIVVMVITTICTVCSLPITVDRSEVSTSTAVTLFFWISFALFSLNVGGVVHVLQFGHQPECMFFLTWIGPILVLMHICMLMFFLNRWGEERFRTAADKRGRR